MILLLLNSQRVIMNKKILFFFLSFSALSGFAQQSVTGKVVSRNGSYVTILIDSISFNPVNGDSVSISKDISGDKNPFGIMIAEGWMGIGDATLYSSTNNKWVFKIYKETANIVVNGEKKEQFVKNKKVKIEWK